MPDLLLRHARIVPIEATGPVEARRPTDEPVDILIRDGRIERVAAGIPDDGATVVDADGRWAIPGLWDGHVHASQWALTSARLDLSAATSAAHACRLVCDHLAEAGPKGSTGAAAVDVLEGFGHRAAVWPDRPSVAALDAVTGPRPVVLISGDAHHGWLNTAAMTLLEIPVREGTVQEREWFAAFDRLNELPGAAARSEAALARAVDAAVARGVVGVGEMEFAANEIAWVARHAGGMDRMRVRTAVYPDRLGQVVAAGWRTGQPLTADGLIEMGPLKVITDGSINTRTAYCCEPFVTEQDLAHPRGLLNYEAEELTALLATAHGAGLSAAVHALGDAAVAQAVALMTRIGIPGAIEHAQLVRWQDLPGMADAGIVASIQPAHLWDDRDVSASCWPDRLDRCFAYGSMVRAGVPLRLGSDAPVAPLDPWLSIAAAVHRSGDGRDPWNPSQALTLPQALAASVDGAGTLAAGERGDIVLCDADPLARGIDPADTGALAAHLTSMPVAATVLDGRVVHTTT